jgi:hypothetical protein
MHKEWVIHTCDMARVQRLEAEIEALKGVNASLVGNCANYNERITILERALCDHLDIEHRHTPEPPASEVVTKRVDGEVIDWAIEYMQDGLNVLKKQFEREE